MNPNAQYWNSPDGKHEMDVYLKTGMWQDEYDEYEESHLGNNADSREPMHGDLHGIQYGPGEYPTVDQQVPRSRPTVTMEYEAPPKQPDVSTLTYQRPKPAAPAAPPPPLVGNLANENRAVADLATLNTIELGPRRKLIPLAGPDPRGMPYARRRVTRYRRRAPYRRSYRPAYRRYRAPARRTRFFRRRRAYGPRSVFSRAVGY